MLLKKLTGQTPDISMITRFKFWVPVHFSRLDMEGGKNFPSNPDEESGHFVGFSEDVRHMMTYKVLTDDTKKIIH